jgi:putative molybdopterin biosynthesis protein
VLRAATVDEPLLAPLWELMADQDFRVEVEALGGYSCTEMGRRVR